MHALVEILTALLSDETGNLAGIDLLIALSGIIQVAFTLSLIHQGLQEND